MANENDKIIDIIPIDWRKEADQYRQRLEERNKEIASLRGQLEIIRAQYNTLIDIFHMVMSVMKGRD